MGTLHGALGRSSTFQRWFSLSASFFVSFRASVFLDERAACWKRLHLLDDAFVSLHFCLCLRFAEDANAEDCRSTTHPFVVTIYRCQLGSGRAWTQTKIALLTPSFLSSWSLQINCGFTTENAMQWCSARKAWFLQGTQTSQTWPVKASGMYRHFLLNSYKFLLLSGSYSACQLEFLLISANT